MIITCNCGEKKFKLPDNSIPVSGRLVQCSFCGLKWKQFPVKEVAAKIDNITIREKNPIIKQVNPEKIVKVNKISNQLNIKKRKKVKPRSGPALYSAEYLQKKHGLSLNEKDFKRILKEKDVSIGFGFYSYVITFTIFTVSFFGILNLTQSILIYNFPFLEIYIGYIFETLDNIKTIINTWNLLIF